MNDWHIINIGKLGKVVTGITPSKSASYEWGDEICFLTPTDYSKCYKYVYDTERKLSNIGRKNHSSRVMPKNSIMVTCIGSDMGKTLISKYETVTNQQINSIYINTCLYDFNFIYYKFLSMEEEFKLLGGDGTTMPILNKSDFSNIKICIPSLPEQKAIAAVLSSFDDKIDLLQRQNATLENMAETLFRQWFIEDVQQQWKVSSLSCIAVFLNGLACQKYPPLNNVDKLPVLKIRELNNGISEDSDWATSSVKQEYIVHFGDVIFSWSGSLLVKIWNGDDCVLNQHLFKVTSKKYPKWFYYLWCKHHLSEFILISESHATTMGHIKRGDLDGAEVIIPDKKSFQEMNKIMNPIMDKYLFNQKQIRILEKLRDSLLPRLMSGEVRVRVDE